MLCTGGLQEEAVKPKALLHAAHGMQTLQQR